MKYSILHYTSLAVTLMVTGYAQAQQGFGTNMPDPSAAVDITSKNKGLLIPRIALTGINNAAPVRDPGNSLMVYNTAVAAAGTENEVKPGYYYWFRPDETNPGKWVRIGQSNDEPWHIQNTDIAATTNNQNIYQQGKVAVGFDANTAVSGKQFEVKGDLKADKEIDGKHYVLETGSVLGDKPSNLMYVADENFLESGALFMSLDEIRLGTNTNNGDAFLEARGLYERTSTTSLAEMQTFYKQDMAQIKVKSSDNPDNNGIEFFHRLDSGVENMNAFMNAKKGVTFKFTNPSSIEAYTFPRTGGTENQVMTSGGTVNGEAQLSWKNISDLVTANNPWKIQNTATYAADNTDNIYQQGKVAVGFTETDAVSAKQLDVKGDFKAEKEADGKRYLMETDYQGYANIMSVEEGDQKTELLVQSYGVDMNANFTDNTGNHSNGNLNFHPDGLNMHNNINNNSGYNANANINLGVNGFDINSNVSDNNGHSNKHLQFHDYGFSVHNTVGDNAGNYSNLQNMSSTSPLNSQILMDISSHKSDGWNGQSTIDLRNASTGGQGDGIQLTHSERPAGGQEVRTDAYINAEKGVSFKFTNSSGNEQYTFPKTGGTENQVMTSGGTVNGEAQLLWKNISDLVTPNNPWKIQNTATDATNNTDNIYQQGKVAVGFTAADEVSAKQLDVKGDFKADKEIDGIHYVLETGSLLGDKPSNLMYAADENFETLGSLFVSPDEVRIGTHSTNSLGTPEARGTYNSSATGAFVDMQAIHNGDQGQANLRVESSDNLATDGIFMWHRNSNIGVEEVSVHMNAKKGVTFGFVNPSSAGGKYTFPRTGGNANQVLTSGGDVNGETQLSWQNISNLVEANNGLTKTANNIQLGGNLTQATTITNNGQALTIATGGTATAITGLPNTSAADYNGTNGVTADKMVSMGANGVLKQLKAAMPKFFYAPSIALPTAPDQTSTSSADDIYYTASSQTYTIKLYSIYSKQFGGTVTTGTSNTGKVANTTRTTALPMLGSSDLDYYITFFDTTVFSDVTVSDTGVMTYKIKPTADVTIGSFMNIVFAVKP